MLSVISTTDLIVAICAASVVVAFVVILRRFIQKAENEDPGH